MKILAYEASTHIVLYGIGHVSHNAPVFFQNHRSQIIVPICVAWELQELCCCCCCWYHGRFSHARWVCAKPFLADNCDEEWPPTFQDWQCRTGMRCQLIYSECCGSWPMPGALTNFRISSMDWTSLPPSCHVFSIWVNVSCEVVLVSAFGMHPDETH